ncbi:hypothetical protein Tco_0530217 [Tanacetum coccineum]
MDGVFIGQDKGNYSNLTVLVPAGEPIDSVGAGATTTAFRAMTSGAEGSIIGGGLRAGPEVLSTDAIAVLLIICVHLKMIPMKCKLYGEVHGIDHQNVHVFVVL